MRFGPSLLLLTLLPTQVLGQPHLNPSEQARVERLYQGATSVPTDGWPGPSERLRFSRPGVQKVIVVHPHRQYDKTLLLEGRIEPSLLAPQNESFVVLEGVLAPFSKVQSEAARCATEEPQSSVNTCLKRRHGWFDPSRDVSLATLGHASISYAWAGRLELDPNSIEPEERITLVGGFFSNCHKNAASRLAAAFAASPRGKRFTLEIPVDLTIEDSGPVADDGSKTAILLSDYLRQSVGPSAWPEESLADWYLGQIAFEIGEALSSPLRLEFWIGNRRLAVNRTGPVQPGVPSDSKVLSVRLVNLR